MAYSFTDEQQRAIDTRDRTLLVSAAAGSGKTATLTERIIRSLTDPERPTSLAKLLVVTFTNASAADMREKIGKALGAALAEDPDNQHLARQQLLLPSARISTIDSLCVKLLRQHADEAGLSQGFRVADPAEAALLAIRVMDDVLEELYGGTADGVSLDEFCELADTLTSAKGEDGLSDILRALYEKVQYDVRGVRALLDARDGYRREMDKPFLATAFGGEVAAHYLSVFEPLHRRLFDVLSILRDAWTSPSRKRLDVLERDLALLDGVITVLCGRDASLAALPEGLDRMVNGGPKIPENATAGDIHAHIKTHYDQLRKDYFTYSDAEFAEVIRRLADATDLLYRVLSLYEARLTAEKMRRKILDFTDIERTAHRLLVAEGGDPTPLAREIAAGIDYIYIDEFQDVNALQYGIFRALSSGDNLFMVGDVKQSIYSFRHADPTIFADLRAAFAPLGEGTGASSLFFSRNFRCDGPIVRYTNAVAGRLLLLSGGKLAYMPEDDLVFSKLPPHGEEPVHTHIFERPTDKSREEGEMPEEESSAAEARFVASEVARLLREGTRADGEPIRAKDITLLFAKRSQMPLFAAALADVVRVREDGAGDFFLNPEVLLALSLLYTIDNPRRDIYLAAVLRSPVFGFTMEDMVRLRTECRASTFYDALCAYSAAHPEFEKGKRFLKTLADWRRLAEGETVGALLLAVFRDAGLMLLGGKGADRHHDNLYRLYQYARSFEASSYHGLYNFISYVNTAIEQGAEILKPAAEGDEDAVRFMTIHGSKGLEFPVCFLCNTDARFSNQDIRNPILYDRTYGPAICLLSREKGATVNNPIRALVASRIRADLAAEQIRLLYVALTRARERLYVLGTVSNLSKKTDERAVARFVDFPYDWNVLSSNSMLSMLLPILCERNDPYLEAHPLPAIPQVGYDVSPLLDGRDSELLSDARSAVIADRYARYESEPTAVLAETEDSFRAAVAAAYEKSVSPEIARDDGSEIVFSAEPDAAFAAMIRARLSYVYPAAAETELPEKLSVSRLYPDVLDGSDEEEHTAAAVLAPYRPSVPLFAGGDERDPGALAGTATHLFMQFCNFERLAAEGAAAELAHLRDDAFLSPEDAERVRLDEVAAFVHSPLFQRLRAAARVRRELRFHATLPAAAFTEDEARREALGDRELLVQGVIDCILEQDDGYVLIDYKTDRLSERELADPALAARTLSIRHGLQLSYYAAACEKMYGKPPREMLIYSLPLGDSVTVDLSAYSKKH